MRVFQAVLAVGEVGAHGGAGRIRVLVANGIEDVFVVGMYAAQVIEAAFRRVHCGVDAGARNDHGAQVSHEVGEVAVARGACNFHVEAKVGRYGVGFVANGALEGIKLLLQRQQVGLGAALRGQAGGLGFQAHTQLQQGDDVGQGGKVDVADLEVGAALRHQREGAHAVAGFHQLIGLQAGNGFAHHGAADAVAGHDFCFGGQLAARSDAAVTDACGQAFHDLIDQSARATRWCRAGIGRRAAARITRGLY